MNKFLYIFTVFIRAELSEVGGILPMGRGLSGNVCRHKLAKGKGSCKMIKVVVADDEVKVCQLICNLVDWSAFDMEIVAVAHNGEEALEMVRQYHPDLLVTDIRMPGCDGLEMIARAKQLSDTLEFVIISGYRHFEYAQSAIKYGVSDYLLKPIQKEELCATLEKMAMNSSATRSVCVCGYRVTSTSCVPDYSHIC